MAATHITNRNRWTKEEEQVVIDCVNTSNNKVEGFNKAAKILGRSYTAINYRYYTRLNNLVPQFVPREQIAKIAQFNSPKPQKFEIRMTVELVPVGGQS